MIGPAGVAFLAACRDAPAQAWLAGCQPVLAQWRRELAAGLAARGLAVRESPANFLLARVGDAGAVARGCARTGCGCATAARSACPAWIRLAAAPPEWREALLAALPGAGLAR